MSGIRTFAEALGGNAYPGRGIFVSGCSFAYFIMGRSENSRNRIFERTPNGIRTRAYDPGKLKDPSLVIYNAVARIGNAIVITNGDQTDTIVDKLSTGGHFHSAIRSRTFEPDPPHYTPRISAIIRDNGVYTLAIVKNIGSHEAGEEIPAYAMFDYPEPVPGAGHLIHTYKGDGNPLPSFDTDPLLLRVNPDIEAFASEIWDALNHENRVSLYVSSIDGNRDIIINSLQEFSK